MIIIYCICKCYRILFYFIKVFIKFIKVFIKIVKVVYNNELRELVLYED